jgi:hypothetical protein
MITKKKWIYPFAWSFVARIAVIAVIIVVIAAVLPSTAVISLETRRARIFIIVAEVSHDLKLKFVINFTKFSVDCWLMS